MPNSTIWIDSYEKVEIDGDGLRVIAWSGDQRLAFRLSRATARWAHETIGRTLDGAEAEEGWNVVTLRH